MELSKYSDEELITEMQKRLLELRKLKKDFKDQALTLKNLNKKLKEAEAIKSHFISHVTNEIVNPFASILGLSKNIMSGKVQNLEKAMSMAELIHSEAFNLDFQLRNIFAAAKIEAGEIMPEIIKVDIKSVIDNVIDVFDYKARQKELQIDFSSEIKTDVDKDFFYTDPDKISLIVSNLLSNSIKFSNAASKIEIIVSIENSLMTIIVRDHGIGIDKKNLQVIFDRFKRLDSTINSINTGHGLGLSVVKAMLDLLEGDISIKSRKNQGTVSTITIPMATPMDELDGFSFDDNDLFFEDSDEF
ncbi:MAG: histidine kinase [Marinilabiliales bacterium]|nr:MAG: histidine kinase [Marinilabiliales bacterium]